MFLFLVLLLVLLLPQSHAWSFVPRCSSRVGPRAARPSSRAVVQMKIQWDPYTGQFLDVGDDAEEIGVPARASKATGLQTDDLKIAGGNLGKANAYIAQKMAEDVVEGVDQLMKELDDLAVEGLAEGEEATWPEITEPMKRVLQNEQAAALETVRRNVDLTRASTVLLYGKESSLASAVKEALKARGGPSRDVAVGGDNANKAMDEVKDAQVLVLLPDSKEGPKLPFGGGGGSGVLEAPQVEALITAAAEGGNLRHVIYLSSLGSEKAQFQFSLDSMSGALEKKKAVEQSIRRLSKTLGFNFSIVRVGALVPPKTGEEGIALEPGDPFSGGTTNMGTAAQAVVQSIALPSALNSSFSLVNAKGSRPPSDEEWRDNLLKLVGPEVLRQPFKSADVQDMRMSLRAWALQFMEGERKLTTKVFAVRTPLGAKIYFLPSTQTLSGPGFREEKAIEKARMKGDVTPSAKPNRPILEGGLEVCVEEAPTKRVRVRRIAMEEGTVVKAMSEKDLLESLKAEIESTEKLSASGRRVEGGTPPV